MRARWLILGTLALVGCQGGTPDTTPAPLPSSPAPEEALHPSTTPTLIGIQHGERVVHVGMTPDDAFRVFDDARKGGIIDEQLPPGLKSPFRARSLESAGRGFGVIAYDDKVVMAMSQEERQNEEALESAVFRHQEMLGAELQPKRFEGNRVSYWFWEKDGQRLMICAFKTDKGVDLTIAMGDDKVMDALNASPEKAETTSKRIDLQTAPSSPSETTSNP